MLDIVEFKKEAYIDRYRAENPNFVKENISEDILC